MIINSTMGVTTRRIFEHTQPRNMTVSVKLTRSRLLNRLLLDTAGMIPERAEFVAEMYGSTRRKLRYIELEFRPLDLHTFAEACDDTVRIGLHFALIGRRAKERFLAHELAHILVGTNNIGLRELAFAGHTEDDHRQLAQIVQEGIAMFTENEYGKTQPKRSLLDTAYSIVKGFPRIAAGIALTMALQAVGLLQKARQLIKGAEKLATYNPYETGLKLVQRIYEILENPRKTVETLTSDPPMSIEMALDPELYVEHLIQKGVLRR